MLAYESDSDVEIIDDPTTALLTARPCLPSPPSTRSSHAVQEPGMLQTHGNDEAPTTMNASSTSNDSRMVASNDRDGYCGLCEVEIPVSSDDKDSHESWTRHCCTLRHQQVLNRLKCYVNIAKMDEEKRRLANNRASVTSTLDPRFPDIREILNDDQQRLDAESMLRDTPVSNTDTMIEEASSSGESVPPPRSRSDSVTRISEAHDESEPGSFFDFNMQEYGDDIVCQETTIAKPTMPPLSPNQSMMPQVADKTNNSSFSPSQSQKSSQTPIQSPKRKVTCDSCQCKWQAATTMSQSQSLHTNGGGIIVPPGVKRMIVYEF